MRAVRSSRVIVATGFAGGRAGLMLRRGFLSISSSLMSHLKKRPILEASWATVDSETWVLRWARYSRTLLGVTSSAEISSGR